MGHEKLNPDQSGESVRSDRLPPIVGTTILEVLTIVPNLRQILSAVPFSLDKVRKVKIVDWITLHPAAEGAYSPVTHTLTLKRSLFHGEPQDVRVGSVVMHAPHELVQTVVHELAHSDSPFSSNDTRGSRPFRAAKARLAIRVSEEATRTQTNLNRYHQQVKSKDVQNPRASVWRQTEDFCTSLYGSGSRRYKGYEETWAILVELYYTDPEALKQFCDQLAVGGVTDPELSFEHIDAIMKENERLGREARRATSAEMILIAKNIRESRLDDAASALHVGKEHGRKLAGALLWVVSMFMAARSALLTPASPVVGVFGVYIWGSRMRRVSENMVREANAVEEAAKLPRLLQEGAMVAEQKQQIVTA